LTGSSDLFSSVKCTSDSGTMLCTCTMNLVTTTVSQHGTYDNSTAGTGFLKRTITMSSDLSDTALIAASGSIDDDGGYCVTTGSQTYLTLENRWNPLTVEAGQMNLQFTLMP